MNEMYQVSLKRVMSNELLLDHKKKEFLEALNERMIELERLFPSQK